MLGQRGLRPGLLVLRGGLWGVLDGFAHLGLAGYAYFGLCHQEVISFEARNGG